MGFEMTLLVARPHSYKFAELFYEPRRQDKPENFTIWRTESVIAVGKISAFFLCSRFEKRPARERAAMYLMHCLWQQLNEITNSDNRKFFAAPFAISDDDDTPKNSDGSVTHDWKNAFPSSKDNRQVFAEPLENSCLNGCIPNMDTMRKHNQELNRDSDFSNSLDLVTGFPLIAIDCLTLHQMIEIGEVNGQRPLLREDDNEARPYFNLWKSCLLEMGSIGARATFVFQELHFPTLI